MSIYLGQLGRMVELKCPATQQVNTADGFSFEETLEGRVKAQARPLQRRTWSLGTSDATTPGQQAAIQGFVNGSWGPGPFAFISADAPVANMLSPQTSASLETLFSSTAKAGGPVNLGVDGWEGSSLTTPTAEPNGMYFGSLDSGLIPVLVGVNVTGSAWLQGVGAKIRLNWYDANGVYMSLSAASGSSAGAGMSRLSVTALPPAGAASCRLLAVGPAGMRGTRPAVTWTSGPYEWAAGEGCPKAVIHAMSKGLVMASRDPRGGRYSNLSYTITEVG